MKQVLCALSSVDVSLRACPNLGFDDPPKVGGSKNWSTNSRSGRARMREGNKTSALRSAAEAYRRRPR